MHVHVVPGKQSWCVCMVSVQLACRRLYIEQHSVSYLRGVMCSVHKASATRAEILQAGTRTMQVLM